MPCGARVLSREGGRDTGVGRSSSFWPNSSMQYKDSLEPPKLAPAEISRNQRKLAETGGNRQKPAETSGNRRKLAETGETGGNRRKPAETDRNWRKLAETGYFILPVPCKTFFFCLAKQIYLLLSRVLGPVL
jgi:hypothetical protein